MAFGYAVLEECVIWLYCVFILYFGGLNSQNFVLDALKRVGCGGPRGDDVIDDVIEISNSEFVAGRIGT